MGRTSSITKEELRFWFSRDLIHSSDIQNTRIFRRCSKRSIFKYFKFWKCEYVKYVNTMNKMLSKLSLSCAQTQRQRWSSIFKYFLKSPKKRIIHVCLNRIESMSLLWFDCFYWVDIRFWGFKPSFSYWWFWLTIRRAIQPWGTYWN